MEFSEKLKKARKRAGLSQGKLAELAGITTRALQYYESGQRHPNSSEIIIGLANAMNIPVSELADEGTLQIPKAVREEKAMAARDTLNEILSELSRLMSSNEISEADSRAFMCAVNDIYFNSRKGPDAVHRAYRVESYLDL